MITEILAVLVALVAVFVTFFKWRYTYWAKRGLPYLEPRIPFGNMENPIAPKRSLGFAIKYAYDKLKAQGHKHAGIYNFGAPVYLPIDPEYVKNVMQRDFEYFTDRGVYYNEKEDPLSAHLFALGGAKWRRIRTKLTPTFTSGKMKMMFDILVTCGKPMEELMTKFAAENKAIDIKEIAARFTTDIIGSCAFGLECNSFQNKDAEFRTYGKKLFAIGKLRSLAIILLISRPEIGRLLGIKLLPRDLAHFFFNVIKDTVAYREQNNVVRKDMLQLLLELKNKQDNTQEKPLTIEEVAAQAFVFFFAGFETSSTTMTFCLFELAKKLELQERVRKEINEVLKKHDNKITYEAIMDLKYMGQVIDETLRLYPPVVQITRKCVKDYKVPNSDVVIEKGNAVFISTLGLHGDPEYFPEPEKFDPERFSEENKKHIKPFSYIPFGDGPRICIGQRFGVMQTKVGLAILLKNFRFTLNEKTTLPLQIDVSNVIYSTKNTIWLDAQKI